MRLVARTRRGAMGSSPIGQTPYEAKAFASLPPRAGRVVTHREVCVGLSNLNEVEAARAGVRIASFLEFIRAPRRQSVSSEASWEG